MKLSKFKNCVHCSREWTKRWLGIDLRSKVR